ISPPVPPYVTGDTGSKFNAAGAAMTLDGSQFWMGDAATAKVASLSMVNVSLVAFGGVAGSPGTFTDAGALTLKNTSKMLFGSFDKLAVGTDISLTNSTISFQDHGELDASGNTTATSSGLAFGDNSTFNVTGAGFLTLSTGTLSLGKSSTVDMVGAGAFTMSGSSAVSMGDNNSTMLTGAASITNGSMTFGNNGDSFTAVGGITASGTPIVFGTGGTFTSSGGTMSLQAGTAVTLGGGGTVQVQGSGDMVL